MTSRVFRCLNIIVACEKYIKERDDRREENLEKWINKYSTYTEGWGPTKKTWERCRASTIHHLENNIGDWLTGEYSDYYFDCVNIHDNEYKVKSILALASVHTDVNEKITISVDDFDLIKKYYE